MSDSPNRFGLTRESLGSDVRREVRKRCRFGCVICGSALVQYHHFDPPFSDAREHRAEGITCLCGGHHDAATRGVLSDKTVRRHDASPFARTRRPHHLLDLVSPLHLVVGTVVFDCPTGTLITTSGGPILSVDVVEGDGGGLLSAIFHDENGAIALEIARNEILFNRASWDATVIGKRFTVRSGRRKVVFEATIHPPSFFVVHRAQFLYGENKVVIDESGIRVRGRAHASIQGLCTRIGRAMHLNESGILLEGGSALIPYPRTRLRNLGQTGRVSTLFHELDQDVLHLVSSRPNVLETSASEECWRLQTGTGALLAERQSYGEALRVGEALCNELGMRMVIHRTDGKIRFRFPEALDDD